MIKAIVHEVKKLSSLFIFFLIGFGYIVLLATLFLESYEVNTYAFMWVIVTALLAAKAVMIIDATPLMKQFRNYPRYISLLYKTAVYTFAVLILGTLEGVWEQYRANHAIGSAIAIFLETRNVNRFLGIVLSIGIVFLIHNIFHEMELILGKGSVKRLFLETPKPNRS